MDLCVHLDKDLLTLEDNMDKETKFSYLGDDYILEDCPIYPVQVEYVKNAINSEFQDGYVTSRPRISRNFAKYSLNFRAVAEPEKRKFQTLESLVNQGDIFIWFPEIPLEPKDFDSNGNLLPIEDRKRYVRLIEPVQYQLSSFNRYDFTINLQEAI